MPDTFKTRMADAISTRGPLCAGIDPSARLLAHWGLNDDPAGLQSFALRCVEAFADVAAAIKPNVAFFERFGSKGIGALEAVIDEARHVGLLVIADAKRGDIMSTNAAYAQAWLGGGPLGADAVTVVPYLGLGDLEPFASLAAQNGRGVFVVARSSNRDGRSIQTAIAASGLTLEAEILSQLARHELSESMGAVIGVSANPEPIDLPPTGFFLAPGVGAQGATTEDLAVLFAGIQRTSILVNLSRSLLDVGPDQKALRDAAKQATDELTGVFCPPA